MPSVLQELTSADTAYIASVAAGHDVAEPDDMDEEHDPVIALNESSMAQVTINRNAVLCVDSQTVTDGRTCATMPCRWCDSWKATSCPHRCGACSNLGGYLPCHPASCCGMKTWVLKNAATGLVEMKFQFIAPYMTWYPAGVTNMDSRMPGFRLAVEAYSVHTCIRFIQVPMGDTCAYPSPFGLC